jgi:hypothetical protein
MKNKKKLEFTEKQLESFHRSLIKQLKECTDAAKMQSEGLPDFDIEEGKRLKHRQNV